MATPRKTDHPQIELQIAPMIDVCFLLLFFYILTSKPVKPEGDLNLKLPGTVAQEQALDIPDEQRIEIQEDGQILLNEGPLDGPGTGSLPALTATLERFKEATEANGEEALVTIAAADAVPHQRIIDVLNSCANAGIGGITFATESEDEEF